MAGVTGLRYNFANPSRRTGSGTDDIRFDRSGSGHSTENTPFFERIGNEEFNELHHCKSIIESQQIRLNRLEKINVDLEYRLEEQAKISMDIEKECISIEGNMKKCIDERDIEIAKAIKAFESEKKKGDRLRVHLSRTEKELYGILQRKYEIMRGPAVGGRNAGSLAQSRLNQHQSGESIRSPGMSWVEFSSDNSITHPSYQQQESKRERENMVAQSLSDFLGI
jgi:hypothetical protein